MATPRHHGYTHYGYACSCAQEGCELWSRPGYLCTQASEEACSYDLLSKAYCDLQTYSAALPPGMQHFDDPTLGGYSELLDYCPVYRAYSNGHCTATGEAATAAGEEQCETCRCVARRTGAEGSGSGSGLGTLRPECHRTRCLNSSSLEVRLAGHWRACPPEGGVVTEEVGSQQAGGPRGWAAREWVCPPAQQLCGMSTAYWPHLSSLSPTHGAARGGLSLTLTGAEFRSMHPPVTLSLGLRDGTEIQTTSLTVLNDTHVIATLPPWRGATAFAWADIALTDGQGRTAFLYAAFLYEPSWQSYAATAALLMAVLLAACCLLPAYLRRGCESRASASSAQSSAQSSARSLGARRTRECV